MAYLRSYFFKTLVLLTSLCLLILPATDADLVDVVTVGHNTYIASTLAIQDASTINNAKLDHVFNFTGFLPPAMAVASFRLRNTGQSNVHYTFISRFAESDPILCSELTIKLQSMDKIIYQGKLSDLNVGFDATQKASKDWIAILELPSNDPKLANKSCNFSLVVDATSGDSTHHSNFYDQQVLDNAVSTGDWD